jgi:predicted phage tail protein
MVGQVRGAGGGKSGGGGAGLTEAPNTLRSKAVARLVEVISEGAIEGLVNGPQSIYFGDTPLMNPDGSYNFEGVGWELRYGLPSQAPVLGFSEQEAEISVGTEITADTPLVRSITDEDVTSARVTIRLPQLSYLDTEDGELRGSSVQLRIEVQANGGGYKRAPVRYTWNQFTGTTSQEYATGLQVIMGSIIPEAPAAQGDPTQTYTRTVQCRYRASPAGAWINFATVTVTRSRSPVYVTVESGDQTTGYYIYPELAVTHVFEVTGLEQGQYDVEALQGSIVRRNALSPNGDITISGKTTSPYEASYRFALLGDPPWDIRVTRLTGDDESVNHNRKTWWSRYTEIIDQRLSYKDSAYVALAVDSQLFGGSIPDRSYEIRGIKVQVPSNYDPETRAYDGIWDGTFTTAWTDNPAWVLYDLLTNRRYGLGDSISASAVDKWGLYTIAQYCDELVDDGFGGTEPRFTCNVVINSRAQAYEVLMALASVFRGMLFWQSGAVYATIDKPDDPVVLLGPANVINGEFQYAGTGLKARHSAAIITWNDPKDAYRTALEVVEDPDAIRAYGWRPIEVTAFGCTSRGQAHRIGRWMLDSEKHETETVTYRASLDHLIQAGGGVTPGCLVKIMDPNYAGAPYAGRVASATVSSVAVDRAITIGSGIDYYLNVTLPDATLERRQLTNTVGSTQVLTVGSAFSQAPDPNAVWLLESSEVEGRLFRVVAVKELERNIFEVTALFHDPTKYARIEQNLYLAPPLYSRLPTGPIVAPTNITTQSYIYRSGPAVKNGLTVSWQASNDARVLYYDVEIRRPDRSDFEPLPRVSTLSKEVPDLPDGSYGVRVRAVSGLGQLSGWTTLDPFVHEGVGADPGDVEDFTLTVLGSTAHLSWTPVADLDLDHYEVRFSPLLTGAVWEGAQVLVPNVPAGSGYAVPAMVGTYLIKAVDFLGNVSVNAATVVSTVIELEGFNAVAAVTEGSAGFPGSVTQASVVDGALRLDTNASSVFYASGLYAFASTFDLGAVFTSRLTAEMQVDGVSLLDSMDEWADVDQIEDWDATSVTPGTWAAKLQLRKTEDDPAGTPLWSAWMDFIVGDYSARAFQFRALLESSDENVSPQITALTVNIDMADRVASGSVTTASAGSDIFFIPAFREKPEIGLTAYDLSTGDFWAITNASAGGFHVQFKDSAGTGISRRADWIAKGYGVQQ